MPISYSFLALRIAYLAKINEGKRFTISEKSLKALAQTEVLAITYLQNLKCSLEELGYFLGSLEGGSYGLFPIQSLKNAPDLAIPAKLKMQFEGYNEEQLRQAYYNKAAKQKIATDLTEVVEPNIKASLWDVLIDVAKNKGTIQHGDLAKQLGLKHHKKLEKPLHELAIYDKRLPRLDYLVINKNTGLPSGIKRENDPDYIKVKERINQYDWTTESNPFTVKSDATPEKSDAQEADLTDTGNETTDHSQAKQNGKPSEYDAITLIEKRMQLSKKEEKTISTTQPETASLDHNYASTENHNSKNDDAELCEKHEQSIEEPITETNDSKTMSLAGHGNSDLPSSQEEKQKVEMNQYGESMTNNDTQQHLIDNIHHTSESILSLDAKENSNTSDNTGDGMQNRKQQDKSSYSDIKKQMNESVEKNVFRK